MKEKDIWSDEVQKKIDQTKSEKKSAHKNPDYAPRWLMVGP